MSERFHLSTQPGHDKWNLAPDFPPEPEVRAEALFPEEIADSLETIASNYSEHRDPASGKAYLSEWELNIIRRAAKQLRHYKPDAVDPFEVSILLSNLPKEEEDRDD